MASLFRKFIKLVGPYPYNPYLIFLFFASIFFSRYAPSVILVPAGLERLKVGALLLLASAVPGLLFAVGAILLNRYRFWSQKSTLLYIFEVAFFQFLNLLSLQPITAFLSEQIGDILIILLPLNFKTFAASLLLALISLALMHQAERRIVERLNTVTGLVVRLEEERERLINSDENLRRQTSQFLHDRVQSDLMVVGMKLKSISGKSSTEVNEVIDRAIIRLETTRASDLKNLIQVLTPNLEAGTLQAALDVLLEQYRNNMEVSVKIDATTEALDSKVLLGIFRIVEQSILNSLVHGPAKRVQITVSTDSMGVTDIIISDDGPGALVEQITSGLGTSIIDSWVGILNGSKEIDSAPGHGYQLHVTFISH
jgi:signal transduction histidine kinase